MNKIDLHVHTIASGHGISTLYEIVRTAKEKGIKAIAGFIVKALINAFTMNPAIDILAHPVTVWYPIDIINIVQEACARTVFLMNVYSTKTLMMYLHLLINESN